MGSCKDAKYTMLEFTEAKSIKVLQRQLTDYSPGNQHMTDVPVRAISRAIISIHLQVLTRALHNHKLTNVVNKSI